MAIQLIAMAALAAYDAYGSKKAGDEADKTSAESAFLEKQMTREELRRMDREQEQRMGTIAAQVGGSGVRATGSVGAILDDAREEYGRERAWVEKVGASKAKELRNEGKSAKKVARIGATSSILSGISDIGDAYDWWT